MMRIELRKLVRVIEERLEYVEDRFEGPFRVEASETYVEIFDVNGRVVASKSLR